jgi:hypothetical protein
MVDNTEASKTEKDVFRVLAGAPALQKYKLLLHPEGPNGIDIVATAKGYSDFGIEIENTEEAKWTSDLPFPPNWVKGFSVLSRKKKFFVSHSMSLFVKVNYNTTRAVVIPMSYIFSGDLDKEPERNKFQNETGCNTFYRVFNPEHPAMCFCEIKDLPAVVEGYLQSLMQMKRTTEKFTKGRPNFRVKKEKEK